MESVIGVIQGRFTKNYSAAILRAEANGRDDGTLDTWRDRRGALFPADLPGSTCMNGTVPGLVQRLRLEGDPS